MFRPSYIYIKLRILRPESKKSVDPIEAAHDEPPQLDPHSCKFDSISFFCCALIVNLSFSETVEFVIIYSRTLKTPHPKEIEMLHLYYH